MCVDCPCSLLHCSQTVLAPPKLLALEEVLGYVGEGELVEVTPGAGDLIF